MALLLDTNALSAIVDGDAKIREVIEQEEILAIPCVVLGEYFFGIRQSRWRARYERWLEEHLSSYLFLETGMVTASKYADIRAELKSAGRPIPSNDLWIAGLSREHSYPVVSRDAHFDNVRGLRRLSW